MAESITHDLANNDVKDQDFDGGLNVKADPSSVKPPQTTRADNIWYVTPGQVKQLPAFATQNLLPGRSIYAVAPRDSAAPGVKGDILTLTDNALPTALNSTRWYHNLGATVSRGVPAPPYTLTTRPVAPSASPTSNGYATMDPNATAPILARQEVPAAGRGPLIATFVYNNGAQITYMQSTYADTGGDIVMSNPTPSFLSAGTGIVASGVAGQSYCCLAVGGSTGTLYFLNFDGSTAKTAVTFTNNGTQNPGYDFVTHNGVTYFVYMPTSTTVSMINCATGATIALASGVTNTAATPFFACSPITHTVVNGTTYLFFGVGGKFYCSSITTSGAITGLNSLTLPTPTQATATGLPYVYGTGAINILDTVGGYGPNASFGITLFVTYPEKVYLSGTTTVVGDIYSVTTLTFTWSAAAGFSTPVASYFRTVGGAQLASKSFCACPPEASFAGPTQSKAAYCLVRTGSAEMLGSQYGQPTYFLLDQNANIVARFGDGTGPSATLEAINQTLPVTYYQGLSIPYFSTSATTPNESSLLDIILPAWYLADAKFTITTISSPANQPPYVVTNPAPQNARWAPLLAIFSMPNQLALPPVVNQQNSAIMSGPMTLIHDGAQAVEAGYHTATFNINAASVPTSGTTLGAAGTYYYVAAWRWTDAQGRVHRSAPSLPLTVASASTFYGTTMYVPLPISQRVNSQSQPICELYRTVVNATDGIYYFVASIQGTSPYASSSAAMPYTTTTQGSPSYAVTISDLSITNANLTSQPRLYTAYNVNAAAATYVSTAPPPFVWQVGTKARIFGLACVQGQWRLYYSSVSQFGIPPEWNPTNYAAIPPDIGTPRSLEAMDDKVIVLGSQALAVMNGDGPAASNTVGVPNPGDGFSQVVPLPQPAGAYGTGAPVRLPSGIAYQSTSGIQMVGRDLTQTPIGAPVDPLTGRQTNNAGMPYGRAAFLPSLQSIVWCNTQGAPLVYNYMMQKWSTWPLLSGAQSIAQRTDGSIWVALQPISGPQTLSTADLGMLGQSYSMSATGQTLGTVAMVLETPWIQVGTTQFGEGELYEMQLGGIWLAPHALTIEQAYNYNVYNQFKPAKVLAVPTAPANYQFRVRPVATSRVWSVRYRITLSALPAGTYNNVAYPAGSLAGAGYNLATLSDMVLSFATKQGASRVSAASSR
jgi:hypothetical protein